MRPIRIGITVHSDTVDDLTDSERVYLSAVEREDMQSVLLKNTSKFSDMHDVLAEIDGLVLIGGGDVHPCHYGRVLEEGVEYMDFNRDRDLFELQLARFAHHLNMPTLGICRGSQVMNVALGGTLISDLSSHKAGAQNHQQTTPYHEHNQMVHVQPGTRLFDLLFDPAHRDISDIDWIIHTNSMHHQAVEHPARGLRINAIGSDGVYEGIEDPKKAFYIGVQWHPEYLSNCKALFYGLKVACEVNRTMLL